MLDQPLQCIKESGMSLARKGKLNCRGNLWNDNPHEMSSGFTNNFGASLTWSKGGAFAQILTQL